MQRQRESESNNGIYIHFSWKNYVMAMPVELVAEIVESHQVVRYPVEVPGHRGVVSLRGGIVPVVDPRLVLGDVAIEKSDDHVHRFVVVEVRNGVRLCLMAEDVGKVNISTAEIYDQSTVAIHGEPVRILKAEDFIRYLE